MLPVSLIFGFIWNLWSILDTFCQCHHYLFRVTSRSSRLVDEDLTWNVIYAEQPINYTVAPATGGGDLVTSKTVFMIILLITEWASPGRLQQLHLTLSFKSQIEVQRNSKQIILRYNYQIKEHWITYRTRLVYYLSLFLSQTFQPSGLGEDCICEKTLELRISWNLNSSYFC